MHGSEWDVQQRRRVAIETQSRQNQRSKDVGNRCADAKEMVASKSVHHAERAEGNVLEKQRHAEEKPRLELQTRLPSLTPLVRSSVCGTSGLIRFHAQRSLLPVDRTEESSVLYVVIEFPDDPNRSQDGHLVPKLGEIERRKQVTGALTKPVTRKMIW